MEKVAKGEFSKKTVDGNSECSRLEDWMENGAIRSKKAGGRNLTVRLGTGWHVLDMPCT